MHISLFQQPIFVDLDSVFYWDVQYRLKLFPTQQQFVYLRRKPLLTLLKVRFSSHPNQSTSPINNMTNHIICQYWRAFGNLEVKNLIFKE